MNLKKYRLLTVFLLTACSQTITDGNLWELKPNSIQSGDRLEVVNRISQRTLKIKLCGVIPTPSSQKYLEGILKKRPDRLILVGK